MNPQTIQMKIKYIAKDRLATNSIGIIYSIDAFS